MKQYIEVGLLLRKQVRRYLLAHDIPFTEDKGWFESVFYLHCSPSLYQHTARVLTNWYEQLNRPTEV